jgi:predicted Fe-S protein YdhL (DUF1289 family)|nr:MAG TPA: DNA-directed RNA polymerase II subunit [Bacteriophage sp.]
MKKIGYCHWCNKYADLNYGFCPFCSSQLISISAWNKMTNKEREDWLNRNPRHNPPKKMWGVNLDSAEKENKQARAELAQEEARKQYIPRCPTCGCPDVERVGFGEKIVDTAVWGFLARKPKCQFRCKNCGYEW